MALRKGTVKKSSMVGRGAGRPRRRPPRHEDITALRRPASDHPLETSNFSGWFFEEVFAIHAPSGTSTFLHDDVALRLLEVPEAPEGAKLPSQLEWQLRFLADLGAPAPALADGSG